MQHYLQVPGFLRSAALENLPSYSCATSLSGSGNRGHSLETLHPSNDCPHCHAYKTHVIYAFLQDDAALERDCMARNPGSTLGFSPDDFLNSELYEVTTQLRRVRQEREDAIAVNRQYQNEVEILESKLLEAKDKLLAIELTYGHDETQPVWNTGGDEFLREEESDFEGLDADLDWVLEHPVIGTDMTSDDFDLVQQLRLLIEDESSSDALQNDPQPNSTLPVYSIDSSSVSPSCSYATSSPSLPSSDWTGSQSDDYSYFPPAQRPTSSITDLRDTLMASQHEERRIRKDTAPRADRGPEIPPYWSSPRSSSSGRNKLASTQPRLSQKLEIFVDASASGIGFVCGTRWLAWSFKKTGNFPLGGDGRIVTSWAELLAVEVGLRVLIEAGHQSTTVIVRSDNMGVVDALIKKSWCPRHGLEEVLHNILNLCGEYRIKLKPRWVSTKDNLADVPSRGVFPPGLLPYKFPPQLPERLVDLLELAVPVTAPEC